MLGPVEAEKVTRAPRVPHDGVDLTALRAVVNRDRPKFIIPAAIAEYMTPDALGGNQRRQGRDGANGRLGEKQHVGRNMKNALGLLSKGPVRGRGPERGQQRARQRW